MNEMYQAMLNTYSNLKKTTPLNKTNITAMVNQLPPTDPGVQELKKLLASASEQQIGTFLGLMDQFKI